MPDPILNNDSDTNTPVPMPVQSAATTPAAAPAPAQAKPAFNPSAPYQAVTKVSGNKPAFNPSAPYQPAVDNQSPEAVAERHASASNPDANYGTGQGETGVQGVVTGVGKEAARTMTGAANLANKVLPASAQIPTTINDLQTHGAAEGEGGLIENIGEFFVGDEALKGLSDASKITALAEKYPLVAKTMELAKDHPVMQKIILGALRAGAVGGAQGAVKGAAEGNAVKEAEGGALGGALGGGAGEAIAETAGAIAKPLAEKFGVGSDAIDDATRGARPGKRNYNFAKDFERAAPLMDKANAANPSKTIEEWADTTADARNDLYKNQIEPLVDKHATEPLGGLKIADGIRAEIPAAMKTFSPDEAKKMEELANQFLPGQTFQLQVKDAEDALQHFNAKLSSTGFWSKLPSERAALLKTDGTIAGLKAAGDSIRDELYGKLDELEPGSNVAELKKDYGALRNVENEIRGQVNVTNRQSPISLKEAVGMITGLGRGGLVGGAMAALPMVDRYANSPEKLISRAVQKAVRPGEEGVISKAAQKVGSAAVKAAPPLAAVTGAEAGQALSQGEKPESEQSAGSL
jgi:hypothetical protein